MSHRRLHSLRWPWAAVGAVLLIAGGAHAGDDKSGVKPNTISLPSGPGAVQGLGENFQPTLNTGTAKYAVSLSVPPGPGGHAPSLTLSYEGGRGNGVLGYGWRLSPPFIQRQTDKGIPRYIDAKNSVDDDGDGVVDNVEELDTFINESGEELVPVDQNADDAADAYFCENEGAFVRYKRSDAGWEGIQPDGTRMLFGTQASAQIVNGAQVFAWLVESITDTNGNVISFAWSGSAGDENLNQKYLQTITYGPGAGPWTNYHFVRFVYESRGDWFEDARPGFLLHTGLRVKDVIVGTHGPTLTGHARADYDGDAQLDNLVRRYRIAYLSPSQSFGSLLASVTPYGADDTSTLPASTFGYTTCNPASTISAAPAIIGGSNEPTAVMDNALVELADLNGDALPDVLKTDLGGGQHTAYINRGETTTPSDVIEWSPATEQASADGLAWNINLESTDTIGYLADMDGDGIADLVYRAPSQDTYYFRNTGASSWEARRKMSAQDYPPPSPFSSKDVKTADLNADKRIDIVQSIPNGNGADYRIWINLGRDATGADRYAVRRTISQSEGLDLTVSATEIVDMNGDHLPDVARIHPTGVEVIAGLGYGNFAAKRTLPLLDYTLDADQMAKVKLRDINGDGLADLVLERAAPGELWYWINRGNYTLDTRRTLTGMPTGIGVDATVRWADMNGNGTTDLVYCDSSLVPRMQTVDIGRLLDCAPAPNLLNRIDNGIGRITLVEYTASGAYAAADLRSGDPWPDPLPFAVEVVSRVRNQDSLGAEYVTEFTYHDGYYDATEHQFRGFAKVELTEVGDSLAPTLVTEHTFDTGRTIEARKGKLLQQTAKTESGSVFWDEATSWATNTLYTPASDLTKRLSNESVIYAYPTLRTRDITEEGRGTAKRLETEFQYDSYGNETELREYGVVTDGDRSAGNDERITTTVHALNTTSWLLRFPDRVTVTNYAGTVLSKTETYYDDSGFSGGNFGTVTKGHPTLVRKWTDPANPTAYIPAARMKYDAYGNVTAILDPLAVAPGGTIDANAGHFRGITYDTLFNTYPTTERVNLGTGVNFLDLSATYNYGLGTILTSTDFNGAVSNYGYDTFGRLTSLRKPGDNGSYPSAEYAYVLAQSTATGLVNYVETRVLDKTPGSAGANHNDHYFIARDYVDGMGRKRLHKEEADPVGAQIRVAVSGAVTFNARAQAATALQPYFSNLGGDLTAQLAFEDITAAGWTGRFTENGAETSLNYAGAFKSTTKYCPLLRPIEVDNPDGTMSKTVYEPLLTKSYDENDNNPSSPSYNTPMVHYNDGLGRLVQVDEQAHLNDNGTTSAGINTWTTTYQYRADDLLTRITDSQNNQKWMTYDGLGRKTFMNDADRGTMTYVYDAASNLTDTVDAKNQQIHYTYDTANRILSEDYVGSGANPDVTYHYDIALANLPQGDNTTETATNLLGRLAYVTDLSGEEHTSYDARGNPLYVVKRVPDPITGVLVSYKTQMQYDAADRVQKLIYPDKDDASYTYNARSQVSQISGGALHNLAGTPYILTHVDYLASGQQAGIGYGNGVETTYAYDRRLRMNKLNTARASDPANPLLSYAYQFDGASNITGIDDLRSAASVPDIDPDTHAANARRNHQRFQYDDLYRLTRVQYSFVSADPTHDSGHIAYRYDRIGNMLEQTSDITQVENGKSVTNLGTMIYGGPTDQRSNRVGRTTEPAGPHALTGTNNSTQGGSDSRAFTYDANGNMNSIDGMAATWDFQDRLIAVENSAMKAQYTYDYTGRRITKKVWNKIGGVAGTFPDLTTVYVNKYFEVREGGQPTKYIFNGDTRVARILGTLNPVAQRLQRIPLTAGWNLVALAVDAADAATQLGIGTNATLTRVLRWDASVGQYTDVIATTALAKGTILWIQASAAVELTCVGSYTEPTAQSLIPTGSRYFTYALLAVKADSIFTTTLDRAALYDNHVKAWAYSEPDRAPDPLAVPTQSPAANGARFPEFIPAGQPIAIQSVWLDAAPAVPGMGERVSYYHQDHLGSTEASVGAGGELVEETEYLAFGYVRIHRIQDSTFEFFFEKNGFSQKEKDTESGLSYFQARYLLDGMGRFSTVDPLSGTVPHHWSAMPQNWNPYVYAKNNPLRFIDPTGCDSLDTGIAYLQTGLDVLAFFPPTSPVASVAGLGINGVVAIQKQLESMSLRDQFESQVRLVQSVDSLLETIDASKNQLRGLQEFQNRVKEGILGTANGTYVKAFGVIDEAFKAKATEFFDRQSSLISDKFSQLEKLKEKQLSVRRMATASINSLGSQIIQTKTDRNFALFEVGLGFVKSIASLDPHVSEMGANASGVISNIVGTGLDATSAVAGTVEAFRGKDAK